MRALNALGVVVVLALAAPHAEASKPVKQTLKGCVADKVFFSIDGTRAYRISLPEAFDVAAFEGQGISISGLLYPGDRFEPDEGVKPTLTTKTCPVPAMRAIKNDFVVRLRIDAQKLAEGGDFVQAHVLIDKAFAMLTPPACDSFSDRAEILAREGDTKGVSKDLAVIRARKQCYVAGKVNPLLVEDVGKVLLAKGEKKLAVEALELANKVCDGNWCREDIKKELAEAKKP
ncbi:MAG: hypothetical protein ABI175_14965 [Polyangiales bacterium]